MVAGDGAGMSAAAAAQGCCLRLPFLELDQCCSVQWWRRVREWSASVAAPHLRKLVRRLGRLRGGRRRGGGKFQYDPLSYALNFDEGREGRGRLRAPGLLRPVRLVGGEFAGMAIGSHVRTDKHVL